VFRLNLKHTSASQNHSSHQMHSIVRRECPKLNALAWSSFRIWIRDLKSRMRYRYTPGQIVKHQQPRLWPSLTLQLRPRIILTEDQNLRSNLSTRIVKLPFMLRIVVNATVFGVPMTLYNVSGDNVLVWINWRRIAKCEGPVLKRAAEWFPDARQRQWVPDDENRIALLHCKDTAMFSRIELQNPLDGFIGRMLGVVYCKLSHYLGFEDMKSTYWQLRSKPRPLSRLQL
jgi:hypothetical protein